MSVAFAHVPEPLDHAHWTAALLEQGYCIIPDLMPKSKIDALHGDLRDRFERTPFCNGDFYGSRTKRFGGLLKRSRHAAAFVQNPLILDVAQDILGPYCDRFQLNLTQALEIWPGEMEQIPHRDQDMWRGPPGPIEYLINVMWPFKSYTKENGGTVMWPRSNHCQGEYELDRGAAVEIEIDPCSALVFLGSTLHGAGGNRTNVPRVGMIVSYCLGWLKPYENQWLVYPPEVARNFSADLAGLVGYRQHRPNLGNYEGQCPSVLLHSGLPEYLGSVDELRDDQVEPLAEFKQRQRMAERGTS